MDSDESDTITISVRYKLGNYLTKPPMRIAIDGGMPHSLSEEGVKRFCLTPGIHDLSMRCMFRRKNIRVNITSPTRITVSFSDNRKGIKAVTRTVSSERELDIERRGY